MEEEDSLPLVWWWIGDGGEAAPARCRRGLRQTSPVRSELNDGNVEARGRILAWLQLGDVASRT